MMVFKKIPGPGPHGVCSVCNGDEQATLIHRVTGDRFGFKCAVIVLDTMLAGYRYTTLPRVTLIRGKFVGIRGRKK